MTALSRRQFLSAAAGSAAAPSTFLFARQPSVASETAEPLVVLRGDARSVGRRFGHLNAEDVRQDVGKLLAAWQSRGLSRKAMRERAEPFRRFTAKFAPAWMDEMAACAAAADVPVDDYVSCMAGKYRDLFFVDECTSFAAVGSATADGASLFHKTRDNVARPQCAYYKRVEHDSKPAGFFAVGDTSDQGLMMMVNDHGLAGSADMGGLPEDRPKGRGVMNPYILRLIAERAECCRDALEIIREMIRDGWYAGGRTTGTHWLFADRSGQGLRVAQNSHREEHTFFRDDTFFLARGQTAGAALVTGNKGHITLRDMNAAAAHPTICFRSSISALTVRIDPKQPAELSSVWVALPAWAPYLPLFPAAGGVPTPVADGRYFAAGYPWLEFALPAAKGGGFGSGVAFSELPAQQRAAVQEELYKQAEEAQQRIVAAHGRGRLAEAAAIATDATRTACARATRWLKEPPGNQG